MIVKRENEVQEIQQDWRFLMKNINEIKNDNLRLSLLTYIRGYSRAFMTTPGSISHHHAYEGGLLKHTREVVHIGIKIRRIMKKVYGIKINKDSLIFCGNIHDVGKIVIYAKKNGKWTYAMEKEEGKKMSHSEWVLNDWKENVDKKYGTDFITKEVEEAIMTHHGGWSDNDFEMKNLLSAVLHSADLISSRM